MDVEDPIVAAARVEGLALLASIHERMAGVTEEEVEAAIAEAEAEERAEREERKRRRFP